MPETLDISDARKGFNTLDKRLVDSHAIYIMRHNKPAFVVANTEYWEALANTLEILSDPEAIQMFNESLKAIDEGRIIDQEDLEEELL